MKRALVAAGLALLAGCDPAPARRAGGSSAASSTGSGGSVGGGPVGASSSAGGSSAGASSASTSSAASTGSTGSSAGSTGSSAGSTGACFPLGTYVGPGQDAQCCTGLATADGYCSASATTASSTSGSGTSGGGTTGTSATGTTTGGTCPANLPDIQSGQVQNPTPCNTGHAENTCAHGFHCEAGYCVLNGGSSPLQITLSFDDAEDLDLHVREPKPDGGYCEIYYGNPGPVPMDGGIPTLPFDAGFGWPPIFDAGFGIPTGSSCSVGWLDRDSNAGCNNLDGINIENVFYPSTQPAPGGTYEVYLDYWEDCDQIAMSNYAIQVRLNGATYVYCGTVNQSQADHGGAGSGFLITRFTLP